MKKCALVIGHSETDPGAVNENSGITEFGFNKGLATLIDRYACPSAVAIDLVFRSHSYRELPAILNRLGPDFIISLHCNAFNKTASGTEVLYYHKSTKGFEIATILQGELVNALGLPDRGVKGKTSKDRGGYLLKNTNAPCVIAEPFFIDNDNDLQIAIQNQFALLMAYTNAIHQISAKIQL